MANLINKTHRLTKCCKSDVHSIIIGLKGAGRRNTGGRCERQLTPVPDQVRARARGMDRLGRLTAVCPLRRPFFGSPHFGTLCVPIPLSKNSARKSSSEHRRVAGAEG